MSEQPFNADEITVDNWNGMITVQKKPVTGHACQMNFPEGFSVTTLEGIMIGKPGDYLMIGMDGEKYPIEKDLFERTYEKIDSGNQLCCRSEDLSEHEPGDEMEGGLYGEEIR